MLAFARQAFSLLIWHGFDCRRDGVPVGGVDGPEACTQPYTFGRTTETLVRCRDFGYLVASNARWHDAEEVLLEESA